MVAVASEFYTDNDVQEQLHLIAPHTTNIFSISISTTPKHFPNTTQSTPQDRTKSISSLSMNPNSSNLCH